MASFTDVKLVAIRALNTSNNTKVQLNLFFVFVLNYLSYNFKHSCEKVFNFGLIFFVSYYFEIREGFHHFGLWPRY